MHEIDVSFCIDSVVVVQHLRAQSVKLKDTADGELGVASRIDCSVAFLEWRY